MRNKRLSQINRAFTNDFFLLVLIRQRQKKVIKQLIFIISSFILIYHRVN